MLARKSAIIVLNSVVGGLLGFVAVKLIALYMGAGIYGQLAFATSLFGMVSAFGNLGFAKAHKKRLSAAEDPTDHIATFATIMTAIAGGYVVLVAGGLAVNRFFIGESFVSTTQATFLLVTVAEATKFLRSVGRDTFEARREAARSEAVIFTEHITRVPLMIIFALFYASARGRAGPIFEWLRGVSPDLAELVGQYAPESLAFAVLAAALTSTVVAFFHLRRVGEWGSFNPELFKSYSSFAAPTLLAGGFSSLQLHSDRAALGFFWSDAVVGRYYGVQRLLSFVKVIFKALGAMLFPQFSSYHSEGNYEALRQLVSRTLRYVSMITVPVGFGATVLAEPAIRVLLSADWLAATGVLAILAFALPLEGMSQTLNHLLYGMDRPRVSAGISITTSVIQIVTSLVLIPSSIFGVPLLGLKGIGAAIGTLIAFASGILLRLYYIDLDLDPGLALRLAKHWLAGGVMGGLLWLGIENVYAVERWFELGPAVAVGALIYAAALWALGEFRREEFDFFREAIHPGEMGDYIREELIEDDEG